MDNIQAVMISAFNDNENSFAITEDTLTVSKLMDVLSGFPEDAPVIISNDKGSSYGYLENSRIRLRKIKNEEKKEMKEDNNNKDFLYDFSDLSEEELENLGNDLADYLWDTYCWMTGGPIERKEDTLAEIAYAGINTAVDEMFQFIAQDDDEEELDNFLAVLEPYMKKPMKEYSLEDAYEDRYALEDFDDYDYDYNPSLSQKIDWAIENSFGDENIRKIRDYLKDKDIFNYLEQDGDEYILYRWAEDEISEALGIEVIYD